MLAVMVIIKNLLLRMCKVCTYYIHYVVRRGEERECCRVNNLLQLTHIYVETIFIILHDYTYYEFKKNETKHDDFSVIKFPT